MHHLVFHRFLLAGLFLLPAALHAQAENGDSPHLCEAPSGPFRQMGTVPVFRPLAISGRYPHLATFNHQGECGTGAVVPWAERLWVITYAPHKPEGSDDKLYEIDAALHRIARPESVGGTPANRMIHRESNQLNIGAYFIDSRRNVRAIPPSILFGRLTATARHLTDPANKVYICDMEGLVYEVDVHSLDTRLLFKRPVPGWHGKGAYSGQGRLVLAFNGEIPAGTVDRFKPFDYFLDPKPAGEEDAGSLCQWDGHAWQLIERRQFTDVTSRGGIYGAPDDKAPLWSIGWDRRSLLLKLLDGGRWQTFRLPIADYSYFGHHGWHTEWPRIREVTGGHFLMNMHGGWFDFPPDFAAGKTAGLRPLGSYLKITGDFCPWNGRIVFGCDDTAKDGFARTAVGDTLNRLIGQSNSNLWFTTWEGLKAAGRPAGFGGPWVRDDVRANTPSAPYLLAGYTQRVLHLSHASPQAVKFTIEIDARGDDHWTTYKDITVAPNGYEYHILPTSLAGQWVRLKTNRDAAGATAFFHYGPGGPAAPDPGAFAAIADIDQPGPWSSAVLRCEGNDRITLGVLAHEVDAEGKVGPARSYQVDAGMRFKPTAADSDSARFLAKKAQVEERLVKSDAASYIVTEGKLRVRLPRSHAGYDKPWATGWPRPLRELVTERSILNVGGSFYLLPRENSGGLLRIKPVCTHNKRITDYCSWRGLIAVAGCVADARPDGHYFAAADSRVGLWFGDIDDLWKLGKPVGRGGPWLDTAVESGQPSDPYLMAGYDRKSLALSHDAAQAVHFTVEVDVVADGNWLSYATIEVPPRRTITHVFPAGYAAHWVRLKANRDCKATAQFNYE